MSNEVDYYDVQSMIRDARSEIRGEIADAVRSAKLEVYNDLGDSLTELRDSIAALGRVLDERTEHLV